ncbi:MAG: hypothetical protein ACK5YR_05635 [Pirellula sp.]|jgi:hypothetical protein
MFADIKAVSDAARPIFESIKSSLMKEHVNSFVSIEPESKEFFLGPTLSDAVAEAKKKYPNRLVHTFRLGHTATVHFGMHVR